MALDVTNINLDEVIDDTTAEVLEDVEEYGQIRVSVRSLVEFILRNGDIDNRRHSSTDKAMQEGSRIHRKIQKSMGSDYKPEVSLSYAHPTPGYLLVVEGRADGIIDNKDGVTIDEIKGTYRDVERMKQPDPVHLAQAKCYAYMYGVRRETEFINVRMTYCNMDTEDIRYFHEQFSLGELEKWFLNLIGEYRKWADYNYRWSLIRRESIEKLEFPFEYRKGQYELVKYVYQTIYHSKKLFLEAPTGVGKTISTIYPSLKAMSKGMGEKIFYFTAKTITRTVAEETFSLLRERGLRFKSVILTAKEKICFIDKPDCNPEKCPYARGHFDRVNDCMYEMLLSEESFTREIIESYAKKYNVCPFELCLDMSLFADGVIGDYNYLFDPHAHLKRFFGEGVNGNYLFLIDEAHNLLDRGREMYSAQIIKEELMEIRGKIETSVASEILKHPRKNQVSGQMTLELTQESEEEKEANSREYGGRAVFIKRGYAAKLVGLLENANRQMLTLKRTCDSGYRLVEDIDKLVNVVQRIHSTLDNYLDEQEEEHLEIKDDLVSLFFDLSHFLEMYEIMDEDYVKYIQHNDDGSFMLKLFCVNPANNLRSCMKKGRSSILFSATFLPIQYYKKLLGGEQDDYEVYARSVFNPEKMGVFIADDVTSKYTRRSDDEYYRMAAYIDSVVKMYSGNYMVFCPSFSLMQSVCEKYVNQFMGDDTRVIVQDDHMSEEDREGFINMFRQEKNIVGFCVLGGIFGEGIDLKKDSLIGAIIIGTGLPQVCNERELLKYYFDEDGENGFDYAYRFPGMNKVLQAAGRVIRTSDDIGVVALLDERFLQPAYSRLFPREWCTIKRASLNNIENLIERFWDSWGY